MGYLVIIDTQSLGTLSNLSLVHYILYLEFSLFDHVYSLSSGIYLVFVSNHFLEYLTPLVYLISILFLPSGTSGKIWHDMLTQHNLIRKNWVRVIIFNQKNSLGQVRIVPKKLGYVQIDVKLTQMTLTNLKIDNTTTKLLLLLVTLLLKIGTQGQPNVVETLVCTRI